MLDKLGQLATGRSEKGLLYSPLWCQGEVMGQLVGWLF